jgi:hypothetical protein
MAAASQVSAGETFINYLHLTQKARNNVKKHNDFTLANFGLFTYFNYLAVSSLEHSL